ncbi:MAG: RbsD/FucU domain-containing protein [Clostridia bacterium]
MIRNIPSILNSDLVKILMDMGHSDEIAIVDRNFPAATMGKKVIYMPATSVCDVLSALIQVLPLDEAADYNVAMMAVTAGATGNVRDEQLYINEIDKSIDMKKPIKQLDRFSFYEQVKNSYAVISTGEKMRFANVILKKGILKFDEQY